MQFKNIDHAHNFRWQNVGVGRRIEETSRTMS